jgi:NADH dehydrogenase [ubiquinone] 1 alpha subcomplex assembly factor 6
LLRASPYHAARRRSYIPLDVAAKHGLAQEDLYRGKNLEALSSAVHEVASAASAHLEKARSLSGTIPAAAKPVLLPAVLLIPIESLAALSLKELILKETALVVQSSSH